MQKKVKHPLFKQSVSSSRELSLFNSLKRYSPQNQGKSEIVSSVSLKKTSPKVAFGHIVKASFLESVSAHCISCLFATAALTVSIVMLVFFTQAKFASTPRMANAGLFDFNLINLTPIDKAAFLASFPKKEKQETINQIHYVTELIRKSTRSNIEARRLAFTIVAESLSSGYDPLFIAAVIKSESTFNKHAVSYAGATGLMQIMPDTGQYVSKLQKVQWKGTSKLRDPEYNIKIGIAYLKYLEAAFKGNKEHVLIAYNWGPQNVIGALRNTKHFPSSCVKYARTIMNTHGRWRADYSRSMAKFQYMDRELLS